MANRIIRFFQKNRVCIFFVLLFNSTLCNAQSFPVNIAVRNVGASPTQLSSYADAAQANGPLLATLALNDLNITGREVQLRMSFQGNGISLQSVPNPIGAGPFFLDGGIPLALGAPELAPYFEIANVTGISPTVYARPLPEGSYQICLGGGRCADGQAALGTFLHQCVPVPEPAALFGAARQRGTGGRDEPAEHRVPVDAQAAQHHQRGVRAQPGGDLGRYHRPAGRLFVRSATFSGDHHGHQLSLRPRRPHICFPTVPMPGGYGPRPWTGPRVWGRSRTRAIARSSPLCTYRPARCRPTYGTRCAAADRPTSFGTTPLQRCPSSPFAIGRKGKGTLGSSTAPPPTGPRSGT